MSHYLRLFSISALLLFLLNSIFMQSVAEPNAPVLFSKEEQNLHLEKMKSMSAEQKAQYRSEQYALLRMKAADIGYEMPQIPPWEEKASQTPATSDNGSSDEIYNDRHKKQLTKYRKDAEEKRKAMHARLEKQRQHIKQRIANLVERHAAKPAEDKVAPPAQYPVPPVQPVPPVAPVNAYPGGAFYPPPQRFGPGYPRYYPMPPAPPRHWGYRY